MWTSQKIVIESKFAKIGVCLFSDEQNNDGFPREAAHRSKVIQNSYTFVPERVKTGPQTFETRVWALPGAIYYGVLSRGMSLRVCKACSQ